MNFEARLGDFKVSTDPTQLDLDAIHAYLVRSYWARGIPKELVAQSIAHSLCFGVYHHARQIGLARVITDLARFAYILDVFVLEEFQGQGLGSWLMTCILKYLEPLGISRIMLSTYDAHEFYQKLGFSEISNPKNCMEVLFDTPWFMKAPSSSRQTNDDLRDGG